MDTIILPRYISAEEFDLMFDDEIDAWEKTRKETLLWEEYYLNKLNKKTNDDGRN